MKKEEIIMDSNILCFYIEEDIIFILQIGVYIAVL